MNGRHLLSSCLTPFLHLCKFPLFRCQRNIAHWFIERSDWEWHTTRPALACWIPSASNEAAPTEGGRFITGTRAFGPDEDPFPHFTFISSSLSTGHDNNSAPTSSASLSTESHPSPDTALSAAHVVSTLLDLSCSVVPNVEVTQSVTDTCSSQSLTVIGSLKTLSGLESMSFPNMVLPILPQVLLFSSGPQAGSPAASSTEVPSVVSSASSAQSTSGVQFLSAVRSLPPTTPPETGVRTKIKKWASKLRHGLRRVLR